MKPALTFRILLWLFFITGFQNSYAQTQNIPIPGGLVIPGTQTCFPFTVSGLYGVLGDPFMGPWPVDFIDGVCIDILTSHPWTLEITLVSPAGTVLTLSSFNGAGGTNYTGTCFTPWTANSIVGAPAPFTGNFAPQQPAGFSIFDGENGNGVWQLCILDTLTDSTAFPPGGPPGWGATSSASGSAGFGTAPCDPMATAPPPIPDNSFAVCNGIGVDLSTYYIPPSGYTVAYYDNFGNPVGPVISVPGTYFVVMDHECWGPIVPGMYATGATVTLVGNQAALGPDQSVSVCQGVATNLNSLFNLTGFTYQWDLNGVPITNVTAMAATLPGTYQIIGNTPSTCDDTALVTVTVIPGPVLGPDQIVGGCPVAPFDLTPLYVTTGLTAIWYLGATPVANASAVTANGIYQLVVMDSNGCTDTAFVTLNFTPGPVLGPDQSIDFCGTEPVNLAPLYNTTGYAANWTLGGLPVANPSSVNSPGVYTLIANNPNGCADTALVTLNLLSTPSLGPDQNVTGCSAGAFDLTQLFNTSGLTTNWYFNGNPVANPSAIMVNGNYLLVVANASGCTDTALVSLNMSVGPVLGADQTINACAGSAVNLSLLYSTGSFSISWTMNGNPVLNPASVSTPGTYQLIASNVNGCADTAVVVVAFFNPPVLGADQAADFCLNQIVNLNSFYNLTGLTANWTLNGNVVANPSAATAGGTYNLIVIDGNGCSDSAAVVLTGLPAPYLGPDQNTAFCPGGTVDLSTLFTTTGFTPNWTLSGIPVTNVTVIDIPGTYQLVVLAANGCNDTALVVVAAAANPVIGNDQQITACQGSSTDLNAVYNTSGYITSWTLNGIPVNNPASVTSAGSYLITCTNAAGCTAAATVDLLLNPSPDLGNNQAPNVCDGTVVDLNSFYSLTGLTSGWSLNGNVIANASGITAGGNYLLVATNSFNCTDSAYVNLTVNINPVPGADQELDLCPWMNVNLNTIYNTGNWNVVWSLNGQPIQALSNIHDEGEYFVLVTDANGCTGNATVTLNNIDCECNADIAYEGRCANDPISFAVIADSAILSVHWTFEPGVVPESWSLQPVVVFPGTETVTITLEATLTCGVRIVEKTFTPSNCADSCLVFTPSAFTPNSDGKNDVFHSVSECTPIEYEIEVRNRYGQLVFKSMDLSTVWDAKNAPEGIYSYQLKYLMPYQKRTAKAGKLTVLR